MKKDRPKYVKSNKGVLYFQKGRYGKSIRFENQTIGDKFFAEYVRLLNMGHVPTNAFVVRGLIDAYYRSPKFQALADRTKKDYTKFLTRLEKSAGDVEVKKIERKHVIAWRDQLATSETPHYANYFVRVLRILLEYAIDIGQVEKNAAKGVNSVSYEKQEREPWPRELIQAARDARPEHDRTRLFFELLYCTGQRLGDVLKMKWTDIKGDAIAVKQGKTKRDLNIPLNSQAMACLRQAERRGNTILTAHNSDKPWSERGASAAMMKLRIEIGAEDYDIHSIRHTVASEIASGEGSDNEVMAMTGHTTSAMVNLYAGKAKQKIQAEKAQKRRKS